MKFRAGELEQHLAGCPACRNEAARLKTFWLRLGAIPEEAPGSATKDRFDAMLSDYKKAAGLSRWDTFFENWWPKRQTATRRWLARWRRWWWGCWRVRALTVGRPAGQGSVAARGRDHLDAATDRAVDAAPAIRQRPPEGRRLERADSPPRAAGGERAARDRELGRRRRRSSGRCGCAAEAFSTQSGFVRNWSAPSLSQDSPLVQIALIDALADSRTPEAVTAIRPDVASLRGPASVNPAVRSHAQNVIQRDAMKDTRR